MKIIVKKKDITGYILKADIIGDCRQCANTLTTEILVENGIPCFNAEIGDEIALENKGKYLFRGIIFRRNFATNGHSLSITAYDRGYHLKKNQTSQNYKSITPEAAATQLCGEFEIPIKSLATTGVQVSRKFFGTDLYSVVNTMYALAGEVNGRKYRVEFGAEGLIVFERGEPSKAVELASESNIISTSTTESADRVINRVVVQDNSGRTIGEGSDEESIKLLGRLQKVVTKKNRENVQSQVKSILENAMIEQKITVDCLGDSRLKAGGAVMMRDASARLQGLFWVESCTHTFQNGVHTCKLIINLKEVSEIELAGKKN